MRRRRLALPLALLALSAPATAHAADDRVIAPNTKAGGVDVGGQTIDAAAALLDQALRPVVERPVSVRVAGKAFRLQAADAKVAFDTLRTAKRAYYAGRDKPPGQDVGLALSHSRKAVDAFAEKVDRAVSRAPRDATMRITLTRIFVRASKRGRTINERILADRISLALADPQRRRDMKTKLRPDNPSVTARALRARNGGTVLTVDRTGLKLRLFKRLRHRKTYGIAIGAAGFDTPSGTFRIQSKQVNPAWHVPNSAWAGSLAGQTIPGGAPNNPLKARWLGVNGSVGIHGTAEEWSIGTRASHGCIRMRVADVIDLYPRVPMGTPVLIR
jgi:lipoprotein-anchoring transpeptidase ErfK/SrfK